MRGAPYALFGAAVRLATCMNALAALMLAGFSVGIIGSDVTPPDLRLPLACFLGGLLAGGCAALFAFVAQLGGLRRRLDGSGSLRCRLALLLALLGFLLALAAFAAGCWVSLSDADDGEGDDATPAALYSAGVAGPRHTVMVTAAAL